MTEEELVKLIQAVRDLTKLGLRLREIEEDLGMPDNHLSGMLNRTRKISEKWKNALKLYVDKAQQIVVEKPPLNLERAMKGDFPIPVNVVSLSANDNLTSEKSEPINKPSQMPPPGLTKSEQIRWHKEKSQR